MLFRNLVISVFGIVLAWAFCASAPGKAQTAAKPTFVMISGYGLYPSIGDPDDPASAALSKALADIARQRTFGIVYGTLGIAPQIAADLPPNFDPNLYNVALFRSARRAVANLWLQLRYYDNQVKLPGHSAPPVNLTAPQLLNNNRPEYRMAFLAAAMKAVDVYVEAYPTGTIILGEEETMYHSMEGGGLFWAGKGLWDSSPKTDDTGEYLAHRQHLDEVFIREFTALNNLLISAIRQKYPGLRVGVHIGPELLYDEIRTTPVYQLILQGLSPLDFTFYDLYEKIIATDADYNSKLVARITLLKQLGQTVFYLAQLHTTNSFGSGGGRALSAAEIDATISGVSDHVDGFGYYTKNAVPTICMQSTIAQGYWQNPNPPYNKVSTDECNRQEDLYPLDANITGQEMVYQNSLERWQYGLSKLIAFSNGTLEQSDSFW